MVAVYPEGKAGRICLKTVFLCFAKQAHYIYSGYLPMKIMGERHETYSPFPSRHSLALTLLDDALPLIVPFGKTKQNKTNKGKTKETQD